MRIFAGFLFMCLTAGCTGSLSIPLLECHAAPGTVGASVESVEDLVATRGERTTFIRFAICNELDRSVRPTELRVAETVVQDNSVAHPMLIETVGFGNNTESAFIVDDDILIEIFPSRTTTSFVGSDSLPIMPGETREYVLVGDVGTRREGSMFAVIGLDDGRLLDPATLETDGAPVSDAEMSNNVSLARRINVP